MERSNSDNSNISGMSLNDLERRYSDNSVLSNDSRLNYSNHSSNNHITNNNSSNYVSNSYFENLYYPTSSMPMNNNSVANSYSYNINNTGTNLPPPRVRVPGMHLTPQQTRHARRIYVGNIPSSYCEEETIKTFLNSVISKGLNEVNDNSYILSIYTNPKKCFSFVELKSMELATACLDLDGIIFKQTVLKVLRANEYKPELVPPSLLSESIKLDLSSFPFANNRDNNNATANNNNNNSNNNNHMNNNLSSYPIMNHNHELTLDSIIDFCSLSNVTRDSLSIVGYPFDQNAKRSVLRGLGCSFAPKSLRHNLRKISYGAVDNPEYGINLSRIVIHDVGDVLPGKVYEETRTNLSYTVSEICCRNSIPFVIGGSNDQAYQSISGLMNVIGGNIGIVSISPQLDTRVLDDTRFCPRFGMGAPSCDGRYICFGAQVFF